MADQDQSFLPEGTIPPLPDSIDFTQSVHRFPLAEGCHFIRLTRFSTSEGSPPYQHGTLRVQEEGAGSLRASGDLYGYLSEPDCPGPLEEIPIFPRGKYCSYLRVTAMDDSSASTGELFMRLEVYSFLPGDRNSNWSTSEEIVLAIRTAGSPAGHPGGSASLAGSLMKSSGEVIGTMAMDWVSPCLRRAVIEIDKVSGARWPLDSGTGADWRSVFRTVGWDVTVLPDDANVPEARTGRIDAGVFGRAELHNCMLRWRDADPSVLDREWRYYLLCVPVIVDPGQWGLMFDSGNADSNAVPREAAAIASSSIVSIASLEGIPVKVRLCEVPDLYFRTAVHEISHAMGLYHPAAARGTGGGNDHLMADDWPSDRQFQWTHSPEDQLILKHMPDIHTRPGGAPFRWRQEREFRFLSPAKLKLRVRPQLKEVPYGAPVRINFTLKNTGCTTARVPGDLSLKAGLLQGTVTRTHSGGDRRSYGPIIRSAGSVALGRLNAGGEVRHSMTLMRGPQGPLFPLPGRYRITVELTWMESRKPRRLTAGTHVDVCAPVDDRQRRAAEEILSIPESLLSLVLPGDHLEKANEAVRTCLLNDTLRPHFAFMEAMRLGTAFGAREADLRGAVDLLEDARPGGAGSGNVWAMTTRELRRAARLLQDVSTGRRDANLAYCVSKLRGILATFSRSRKHMGELKELEDALTSS